MENQLVSAFLLENNKIEISYISDDIDSVSFLLSIDGVDYPLKKDKVSNVNQIYSLILSLDKEIELGHYFKIKTSHCFHDVLSD